MLEGVRTDPVSELSGLRALARSLVRGDADADDLVQDTAVRLLEHPPELDRPVRPWLVTVMLNRWRMDRRSEARRRARELATATPEPELVDTAERAQTLRRLGEAVEKLPEPYRALVMARYFDGRTSSEIAAELGIPAVTVRTRLLRALEKLRKSLDETAPRKKWMRALVPAQGGWLIGGSKGLTALIVFMFFMAIGGGAWYVKSRSPSSSPAPAATASARDHAVGVPNAAAASPSLAAEAPPGQGQTRVEVVDAPGGAASGRVIDWSTGEGVANAEVTFTSLGGAITVKTAEDGGFELVAPGPGRYALGQVGAIGYLPYSPEIGHSNVEFTLAQNHAVRGLTVFLFQALDYNGRVIDVSGAPVAGAKVSLAGSGETSIDRVEASWTTDRDGRFVFHATDMAVLEAVAGDRRGWSALDEKVMLSKQLVITVAKVPARDATISGRVVDDDGRPLPDVLVTAMPEKAPTVTSHDSYARAKAFAVTDAKGAFEIRGLDRDKYDVMAELAERAPAIVKDIPGGTKGVNVPLLVGTQVTGTVVADGKPVPSFTLLAFKRNGSARDIYAARSLVDADGKFSLRLPPGQYELLASSSGWAASALTTASAPSDNVKLELTAGAIVRGTVVSAADGKPIRYARVTREGLGGGASALPAVSSTVTRADGTFELRGVSPGPVTLIVAADGFDAHLESGLTATDGAELGPVTMPLSPFVPGATPKTDYVGIGVELTPDGDDILVQKVYSGGGAQAAGIVAGDHITAVDGSSTAELGLNGVIAKIRGLPNTTLALALRRAGGIVTITVTRARIQA
jgi:RNA polymerase sigma factor (sigma-70 family)